jgi:hypothetical protein
MPNNYIIIRADRLALVRLNGRYDYDETLMESIRLLKELQLHNVINCLIDIQQAEFLFSHNLTQQLFQELYQQFPEIAKIRTVFVTNIPKTTIYALLFKREMDEVKGRIMQCSTIGYGILSLNLRTPADEILFLHNQLSESLEAEIN